MNLHSEPTRRLKPYAWSELHLLPKRKALIKGLLDCGAMSVIYGESNCGKTFLVLDLAAHIARGISWRGMKTRQGAVVYVAAEGGLGLEERLTAFRSYHEIGDYPPLYVIPASIDLCSYENDLDELTREIKCINREIEEPNFIQHCKKCGFVQESAPVCKVCGHVFYRQIDISVVVIDTLSRAMAGGNENSPEDMTAFIGNCDKLREATGAHVMVIHHSGKDRERGARGHSALKAAVDTEIEVTKDDGIITAEVKKQRDGKTGTKFSFIMQSVSVGQDDDGDQITSCALIPTDRKPITRRSLKGQKKRALGLIRDCVIGSGEKRNVKSGMPPVTCITLDQARDALKAGNISAAEKPDDIRRIIGKVITELNDLGITVTYGDYIWLPEQPD